MKKKLAFTLTLALLLTLCACQAAEGNAQPTAAPTVAPTDAPTQAPTAEPTQEPTAATTEVPKPVNFKGWDILDPNKEFTRNADGIIVLAGTYHNHMTNGFLIAKTGVDFLSFYSGEPVWLTGKQEHISVTHAGTTYTADFVWCTHAGEVGTNSVGMSVSPIPGNDRFVTVQIPQTNYWYLMDLQTHELSDPLSKLDPQYHKGLFQYDLSPNADKAIFISDNGWVIWNFADGTVKTIAEFTGIKSANLAFWASGTQVVLVTTRNIEPEVTYADAVLYDLTDGSVKELYKNVRYGYFRDMGGLEHRGRMYCYYDKNTKETVFVDAITGTQGRISHIFPAAMQMGISCIEYYDEQTVYILKPDGTATPIFTTKGDS